ncbi:MAG: OsmC family protein [Tannerellaceae bacterium]|nr:OsmC family protein [Tannerellaceae bacterium]
MNRNVKQLVKLSSLLLFAAFASCARPSGNGARPTLPDFQKRRLAALEALAQTPSNLIQPIRLEVRATAEQRAGVRRIRIRGHQIISDSDYAFAGYSLGPGSPESSLTAIASDLADAYLSQASLKGVRIDSLGVSITSRPDSARPEKRIVHPHNLLYTIYVKSPASDEQLEELRLLAEQHSPAFNIASVKQSVKSEIDYGQTPEDLTFEPPYQPGLREYLKYKRAALLARRDFQPNPPQPQAGQQQQHSGSQPNPPQPQAGQQQRSPQPDRLHVEADPVSGARKVHIRYFNFIHDNPSLFAGNDLGPSSLEHQLGALASCITHITEIQAASRQVALDTLYVTAQAVYDPRAGRPGFEDVPAWPHEIQYTVHYRSPHSYDEIVALRNAVEEVCPIYNLFISEQKIEGRIVRHDPGDYRIHPQYYYQYRE